ncbi:hypothetical protein EON69_00085 [bacterium]|nr:MAG: hypothetical protein EON69_00085 [bacterium]
MDNQQEAIFYIKYNWYPQRLHAMQVISNLLDELLEDIVHYLIKIRFLLRYIYYIITCDISVTDITYIITIPISIIQKEIIVGTLLGDASLERRKPTHNTRLRFDQTYPDHNLYIQSIYHVFQNLTGPLGVPKIYIRKPDKRTGKVYMSIAFKTRALESLNCFYDLFYTYDSLGKRRKIVPTNIGDLLTSRALAY